MNKNEQRRKPSGGGRRLLAIILVLLIALCFAGGALAALIIFMPSHKVDSYYKYVKRGAPSEYALVFEGGAVPDYCYALSFEDDILLDMEFMVDYGIDPYLFWDDSEKILTVSTPLKIIRMKSDEAFYEINGKREEFSIANTALYADKGKVFVPLSFIMDFYQVECTVSDESRIVIVDSLLNSRMRAEIKANNAPIRYKADVKSDIAEKLSKGSYVYIYGNASGKDDFYYVRTENGAFGYIKTKDVQNIEKITAEPSKEDKAPAPAKYAGRAFTLVWDQIYGEGEKNWLSEKLPGLDIVSPTWLALSDGAGNIKDTGAKSYAEAAKSAGYALWPLFSNGFDAGITFDSLSSTAKRQKIIDGLLASLKKYGSEGLNIDFEAYKIEDGALYTQFLRELCVALRLAGYISSVDLPPPTLRNSPTDREQIGKYADYVIVMAYDQHWSNGPSKGPVAAYDWVLAGIENTLSYVPSEKVALGLPLYNRIWYESKETGELISKDFALSHVTDLFALRGAKTQYEENTGYERGEYEYEIDGVLNTITSWLETNETLRQKAGIISELNLAGAACWKKGLETEDFWKVLSETVK